MFFSLKLERTVNPYKLVLDVKSVGPSPLPLIPRPFMSAMRSVFCRKTAARSCCSFCQI